MARDDDPINMTVKTEIALVVRRIAKEYTQGGTRSEFICGGGRKVRVLFFMVNRLHLKCAGSQS